MTENDKPSPPPGAADHHQHKSSAPSPSSFPPPVKEAAGAGFQKAPRYPNPPDAANPDPATLREQWRFATRQYSRWYAHAWGTAILAGAAFFALGWLVKGSNPLPSRAEHDEQQR